MLDFDTLNVSSALAVVIITLGLGLLSYWANPERAINKAFLSLSIHVALWLMCLEIAIGGGVYGLFFLRLTAAIGTLIPWHLWYLKECVYTNQEGLRLLRRSWPWIAAGLLLALLCFTAWYIPPHSTPRHRVYGFGYYGEILGVLGLSIYLLLQTIQQARHTYGLKRMELHLLILNFCCASIAVLGLMAASAILHDPSFIGLQPIAVLIAYGLTAFALLSSRVCYAGHLMSVFLHKVSMMLVAAAATYAAYLLLSVALPDIVAYVLGIGVALLIVSTFDARMRKIFGLTPSSGPKARAALLEIGRRELRTEQMADAYADVLKGWIQADKAWVFTDARGPFEHHRLILRTNGPEVATLRSLRWATPESLLRQRNHSQIDALDRFVRDNAIGAIVVSPGPTKQVIVATSVPSSRRPITYPEIVQLLEFAAIIEASMQRALFSALARRSEQLATVGVLGAGIAHEIRNPLVTLKTFAQLFPYRHSDPAFRTKFSTLLTNEVDRIERLTEQLLDMASPHNYVPQKIALNHVAESCMDLIAPKASSQRVQLRSELGANPDLVHTDPHAVRQVLLNLCLNGIQAMEGVQGDKWLLLATRRVEGGVEISVTDNGPGLHPDIRDRLFQPFVTSKSSGFGLGLAICGDILTSVGASISADAFVEGQGATFRVLFPEAKD